MAVGDLETMWFRSTLKAHLFLRGLTLCHMDAMLRRQEEAQRFLVGGMEAELAARGVEVIVYRP